jgi:NADPH:quinone reductase-like Zn-dependent oxidoreductase
MYLLAGGGECNLSELHAKWMTTSYATCPQLELELTWMFRASAVRANRAIVYTQTGDPSQVLSAFSYKTLPPPPPDTLNIRILLAPLNPADINVVQGVYPAKPSLTSLDGNSVFVGGNEGLAEVTQVGTGVFGLSHGDWVVMTKSQAGTWSSSLNVGPNDVLKLPRVGGLTEVHGATMTVRAVKWTLTSSLILQRLTPRRLTTCSMTL